VNRIFVASDGTGETAEQVLRAALMQFETAEVEIERRPEIRAEEQIHQLVQQASQAGGLIIHTLVSDELRDAMVREGRLQNVETIDLMGPLLARLSRQFAISPSEKPGLFRQLNEEYFRRIETMEFAFHHDDGRRAHELSRAEIVLVGVSRTFKTPLSVYLAFRGWFVANVPIVLGIDQPPELFDLLPDRVIGLTIDPVRLADLRRVREQRLGGATGDYAVLEFVRREVAYARHLFDEQRWPVVEVTDKPIEESASEILALVKQRGDTSVR
jgi:hypothetical protein